MKTALLLLPIVLFAGCDRKPPPAKPRPADTPSILVYESSKPTGSDELPFSLPKDKLYVVNGSWRNRSDPRKGEYDRPGQFTFEKADDSDVDPKEIAAHLNRWIDRATVRVLNQVDLPATPERLQRTIEYQTDRTTGRLDLVIQPGVPFKKVTATFDIRERRR
jgi:hypothetical protein